MAFALAKIPMPCLRAGPTSFSRISAEAFLLSGDCGYHKLSLRGGTTWQSRSCAERTNKWEALVAWGNYYQIVILHIYQFSINKNPIFKHQHTIQPNNHNNG